MRGLWARLDDAMNPIVVKELRQAVQSKFVVSVLILLLLVQLTTVMVQILSQASMGRLDAIDFQGGREVFAWLQGILLATCMLFIPLYTGIRLAAERGEANTDLLFITTIQPSTIIRGKVVSAVVLAVLIFSACMPFMALTYYLRGIDWTMVLYILGIDFLVVMASVMLMVFLAVVPCNRVFRAFLGLGGFVLLLFAFMGAVGFASAMLMFGGDMSEPEFWLGTVAFVTVVLLAMGFLYVCSIALLQAPSANRALPVRIFFAIAWVASFAVALLTTFWFGVRYPLAIWLFGMTAMTSLQVVIAINERRSWSARVTRTIPQSLLRRSVAFLFYTGAAGGILYAALLFLAALATTAIAYESLEGVLVRSRFGGSDIGRDEMNHVMLGMTTLFLYAYGYGLLAALAQATIFRSAPVAVTWVILLVIVAFASVVPVLISWLINMQRWIYQEQIGWMLPNPFAALIEVVESIDRRGRMRFVEYYFLFALVLSALMTALGVPWIVRQVKAFRPEDEPAMAVLEAAPEASAS